eukprot:gene25940-31755_t
MPAEDAARKTNGLAGASFEGFVVDAGKLGMHVVDVQQAVEVSVDSGMFSPDSLNGLADGAPSSGEIYSLGAPHVANNNGIQTPKHQSPKNYEELSSAELHQPRSLLADNAYR